MPFTYHNINLSVNNQANHRNFRLSSSSSDTIASSLGTSSSSPSSATKAKASRRAGFETIRICTARKEMPQLVPEPMNQMLATSAITFTLAPLGTSSTLMGFLSVSKIWTLGFPLSMGILNFITGAYLPEGSTFVSLR
ncbi:hypothetical protein FR483_n326R [Paramecium bursaria Chlorella virus FR483]|uniref:Uncharacterized protein n326R n=1 Tax=Paramecium bursaria Chlorella virus FR483 TaxID=399781 RepID=A7J730_PBCVF|nr:hypothetical protein FR483_n326R [Paramecium bursaria Chlorella virus FR483]ABT15611.1 hypothetical protein FR483_n326R [Paramecium bursaria Chlorella virus FR483]